MRAGAEPDQLQDGRGVARTGAPDADGRRERARAKLLDLFDRVRAEDERELAGRDLGQTGAPTLRSCTSDASRVRTDGSVCGSTP
jgi:hypothetical protein